MLLGEISKHVNSTEEVFRKIEHMKKLYGEQIEKLAIE